MPPITDAELLDLRQQYQSAYTAHQRCVQALKRAAMNGELPSDELLRQEATALRLLDDARTRQLAGWAELADGSAPHGV